MANRLPYAIIPEWPEELAMRFWRSIPLFVLACGMHSAVAAADAFTPEQQGLDVVKSLTADDARTGIFSKGKSEFDYLKLTGPFINTSPARIAADYDKNEISADEKYKDVWILFSAQIAAIRKDAFENPYISFDSGIMMHDVEARMDESVTELSKLSKGDVVGLVCKGASYVLLSPVLEHCQIRQNYENAKAQEASKDVVDWLGGGEIPPFLDSDKSRTVVFYMYFMGTKIENPKACINLDKGTEECSRQMKSLDPAVSGFQSALDGARAQLGLLAQLPKFKH